MEALKFSNYYRKYGYSNSTYRHHEYSHDLKEAIIIIRKLIEDYKDNIKFYDLLLSLTNKDEDIKIIKDIMEDELKHNKVLKELYFELTGSKLKEDRLDKFEDNMLNYKRNLERGLKKVLEETEKYRKIMAAMPDRRKTLSVMEILTDKLRHASWYNFLIAKCI